MAKAADYHSSSDESEHSAKPEQPEQPILEEQRTLKLGGIFRSILATTPAKRPILSKKRKIEQEIDNEKLEQKAKRVLSAERKLKLDTGRTMPEPEAMQYEKTLRKMATKGVVQLFNALRQAQKTAQEAESEGIQKNTAQVPVVSKKAFLQAMKEDSTPEIQKPAFLRDDFNTSAEKHWENADEVF